MPNPPTRAATILGPYAHDPRLAALRKQAADAGVNEVGQYMHWLERRVLEGERELKKARGRALVTVQTITQWAKAGPLDRDAVQTWLWRDVEDLDAAINVLEGEQAPKTSRTNLVHDPSTKSKP